MEDQELRQKIELLEAKLDEVQKLTKRIYKIFVWTGIITIAAIVLPLFGLLFAIPSFLNYYSNISNLSNLQ